MKNFVIPLLKEDKVHEFENLVSIMINGSFKNVDTEYKLDKCLSNKGLISRLRQLNLYEHETETDEDEFEIDVDETETE